MADATLVKKSKINLSDYPSQADIQNRILLSDFSPPDIQILEEILFSPLKLSFKKLCRSLPLKENLILSVIQKLQKGGLLSLDGDIIAVDKEMRKYFEFQIQRFDPDFKPDMEFIQGLLKKVPIHYLPTWYSVPRSSNNIFESIVERQLLTPQIFQRFLLELRFNDPVVEDIFKDVVQSPHFQLNSSDLIAKYNLTRPQFEEAMLLLEFHFACCVSYQKEEDYYVEIVSPFYEWKEYLRYLRDTEASYIQSPIEDKKEDFIDQATEFLQKIGKNGSSERPSIVQKLIQVKLLEEDQGKLHLTKMGAEWLEFSAENKALFLYRSANNRILTPGVPQEIANERNIREAEKSIRRALHGEWVYVDDFLKGALVPLSEHSVIQLRKSGKNWKYTTPVYSDGEKALLEATILEWLYECGMVAKGQVQDRKCFAITPFGRYFFEE